LKMASYALTNRDLRDMYLEYIPTPEEYASVPYPENIGLWNLIYFWWAPTLIYQPVYPRTDTFRWGFFVKRCGEAMGILFALWFIIAQYATPILNNSISAIDEFNVGKIIERVLELSTVSPVAWLAGFFCLFHSTLNALAEVMHFADRKFYDDWWNCGSMRAYWRLWNVPVHSYFKRHIYIPLKRRGWSSWNASMVVFILSAVIHEILLGVPTHALLGVGFLAMLGQVPLVYLTEPSEDQMRGSGTTTGNCIFWISLCLGPPFGAICYFYRWNSTYCGGDFGIRIK